MSIRLRHATGAFFGLPVLLLGLAWMANAWVGAPTDLAGSVLHAGPPRPLPAPVTLRVVTFNIADGYLFTTNRAERMAAIAARLNDLDPDLVALQEAFIASDRATLRRALAPSRLEHEVRFPGALVGNGLWILSAHPIQEHLFHRFANSNPWYRVWEGDWWAGKGVGLARVVLPGGGVLDVFDTHAQAGRGNPANEQVRLGQMRELAAFVRRARTPGAPALLLGDFNTRPGAPDYELLVRETPLVRAMSIPSEIDHVFAVDDPAYAVDVQQTAPIRGRTRGAHEGIFLARAPSPGEWWRMHFGPPGPTALSDHPGYAVTLRIRPRDPRGPGGLR